MKFLLSLRCKLRTVWYTVQYQIKGGIPGIVIDGHEREETTYRLGYFESIPVEWEEYPCRCGHVESGWRRMEH